jgi:hypothetical protein
LFGPEFSILVSVDTDTGNKIEKILEKLAKDQGHFDWIVADERNELFRSNDNYY